MLHELIWVIVIFIVLGAFFPNFGFLGEYRYPAPVMPSLLGIAMLLLFLRLLGIL